MRSITVPPTAGLPLQLGDLWPFGAGNFAQQLATWLGIEAVQLECSGTSALMVALRSLKSLKPGRSEIIAPAYTCPLVALAIAQCGLQLRLCDLRADALDMDPACLQRLCCEQTLAVLPTHLCGRVADVDTALHCARAVGAYVIEDAAQALGARNDGESLGLKGDLGFFSLAVGKGLSTFEGGVLIAREPAMRAALSATGEGVRFSPWWELRRSVELLGYAMLYQPSGLRMAYGKPLEQALSRGDWVEAAGDDFDDSIPQHRLGCWRQRVGAKALPRLAAFQQQTDEQARARVAQLQACGLEVVQDIAPHAQGVWPVILLRMPSQQARDTVLRAHWADGSGLSLPFVHVLPDYGRYDHVLASARHDDVSQARDWAQRLLAISNSPWLDDARFAKLLSVLEGALQQG
ncbi:MAG: DegT/DnrJ/EryC1/StrS family aminotransferase [Comamonas sp.]|jgi:dTDP-4-amino-4,6-dideoxygalactose transaminase|uniref:DegT/DnrJ/EryC1/StrS family aminotransferase n=1 Tax=Comamonas sp. TaxID=34028 RepID=UPI00283507B3|nr:DegT/DnrJ/EryC1/StrS family aminotransferase [Comamonas sp.]MDR0216564.1 DegT/DnrJ/EryC1/StrS family aminotransferase [Comamonas sp.]